MTDKELYLTTIYECDKVLDEVIPIQMDLHKAVVLMGNSVPNEIMREVKETDSRIETVKKARSLAQDILFDKYKIVVLSKWQEAEP